MIYDHFGLPCELRTTITPNTAPDSEYARRRLYCESSRLSRELPTPGSLWKIFSVTWVKYFRALYFPV